jgi:hypothetical protein
MDGTGRGFVMAAMRGNGGAKRRLLNVEKWLLVGVDFECKSVKLLQLAQLS